MTYTAKIIQDSIHQGKRITTMELKYPRFIHSQMLTHRAFSRNSGSSRAIPVERLIQEVEADPVNPLFWGANRPGMQATEELPHPDLEVAQRAWEDARAAALQYARRLAGLGAHKQIVNRLLEPFQHISTIVTATDYGNFFNLRIEDTAQPEIQAIAKAMKEAMDASTPVETTRHLPYVRPEEIEQFLPTDLEMISAARCARVSYLNHDGTTPDVERDLKLARSLREHRHLSPFEHQAVAAGGKYFNLDGWKSQRYVMETQAL